MNLALFDDERSGRPIENTDDVKTWIISVACQKPCFFAIAEMVKQRYNSY